MASPYDKWRISVHIAPYVPGQQSCLSMPKKAYGHSFRQKRVFHFLPFAFLPSDNDVFSCRIVHKYRSRFSFFEAFGFDLASIDQRAGEPVGQIGAKFFHHVQREAWPARPVAVQKSHCRIKPAGFQSASYVMSQ